MPSDSQSKTSNSRLLVLYCGLAFIVIVILSTYVSYNPLLGFISPAALLPDWLLRSNGNSRISSWLVFFAAALEVLGLLVLGVAAWRRRSNSLAWCLMALVTLFSASLAVFHFGASYLTKTQFSTWSPWYRSWLTACFLAVGLTALTFLAVFARRNARIGGASALLFMLSCLGVLGLAWVTRVPNFQSVRGTRAGEGLAPALLYGRWGYIDGWGKVVIRPQFLDAGPFSEGVAAVGIMMNLEASRPGYIDRTGKVVLEMDVEEIGEFHDGLARVRFDWRPSGKFGFMDRSGKLVIKPQFDHTSGFSEGLAAVSIRGEWGYIDKAGKLVIPLQFDSAHSFREGLALVRVGALPDRYGARASGRLGYIDHTGEFVIEPQFDHAESFREGLALVEVGGKFGFIDKTGKLVIEAQFDSSSGFSEGLANVQVGGNWGYIDKTGKVVIPFKFDRAKEFSQGRAAVQVKDEWFFIDRTGNFQPAWKRIWHFPNA